jgi:hypothetical protein
MPQLLQKSPTPPSTSASSPKRSHLIPKTRPKERTMSLKANLCSYPNIFRAPSTRPVRVTIGFVTIAKTLVIVFETYVHHRLFTFSIYCIISYSIAIVFCLFLPTGKCCESGTGALRRYDDIIRSRLFDVASRSKITACSGQNTGLGDYDRAKPESEFT